MIAHPPQWITSSRPPNLRKGWSAVLLSFSTWLLLLLCVMFCFSKSQKTLRLGAVEVYLSPSLLSYQRVSLSEILTISAKMGPPIIFVRPLLQRDAIALRVVI